MPIQSPYKPSLPGNPSLWYLSVSANVTAGRREDLGIDDLQRGAMTGTQLTVVVRSQNADATGGTNVLQPSYAMARFFHCVPECLQVDLAVGFYKCLD